MIQTRRGNSRLPAADTSGVTTLRGALFPGQRRSGDDDGWRARARTHKVQIRPDVTSSQWYWFCLTCGPPNRSAAVYADHATASAAAFAHDTKVDLLP